MFERGRSDALGVRGFLFLVRFDNHWTRSIDICTYICKSLPPRIYIDSTPCNDIHVCMSLLHVLTFINSS
jgi:hypothetical protein